MCHEGQIYQRVRPRDIGDNMMKKNNFWEVVIRVAIAALTAALTALGTTSCMGMGPLF